MTTKPLIFTIGHSTRPIDEFIKLLEAHGIKEIVDVRSIPMSRYNPQFNSNTLQESLRQEHIQYKHLKKLGGWLVKDVISMGSAKKHRLTPFLKIKKGRLTYPESKK